MKKTILNIGETLNKVEQKSITGGSAPNCYCGLFLEDTNGNCFYRINGVDFGPGTVDNGCCCGASF